jgi:hypothetical protein
VFLNAPFHYSNIPNDRVLLGCSVSQMQRSVNGLGFGMQFLREISKKTPKSPIPQVMTDYTDLKYIRNKEKSV